MPKILFLDSKFENLSCEAKLLYGILLDRMQLSIKNYWMDEEGKVYIYFSQKEISKIMGCGVKKVGNLLAELDSKDGIGLITRIRQGLGKPDRIYVRKCTPKKGKEKEGSTSFSFPFGISLFLVSSYLIPRFAFTLLVKLMLCDSFTYGIEVLARSKI